MASVENFNAEEDEILITLVSQHPLLYDLSVEDYRNTRKKDKAWSEIGVKLNKSGDSCKKHWKNLKDTYLRQKRKGKSGTGSAAPKNPRSKFNTYAKLFSFLESVPNERSTISNHDDPHDITTQESESSQTSTQDRSPLQMETNLTDDSALSRTSSPASSSSLPYFPKSKKTRTKKDDILTYLQRREVSRQTVLQNLRNKDEDDDLSSFSDHVKSVLRKLTPLRKIQAKRAIFDILITYQTLDVESADIESDRPTLSSGVSSNISIDCYTPESQDTPDNATRPQNALESVSNNNNLPVYSPISQDNVEEPTDLTLAQFIEKSFFEE